MANNYNFKNTEVAQRNKRRWRDNDNEISDAYSDIFDDESNLSIHAIEFTVPREIDINNRLTTRVMIKDQTDDDKFQDYKLVHTKLDSELDSGSYIWWSNDWWLVNNENTNATGLYRSFVVKRCNSMVNIKYKGKIYTYPVCMVNATTLGVQENEKVTTPYDRRTVDISCNPVTDVLDIFHRIMVNKKYVSKILQINEYSYEGCYEYTLSQVAFESRDDKENLVAYNDFNDDVEIIGDDVIYPNVPIVYTCEGVTSWSIENNIIAMEILSDMSCKIICTDSNSIGGIFTLIANVDGIEIRKEIRIGGWF